MKRPGTGPSPAVFLDKDGTLIVDVPFNVDPDRVRLMPGAAEGLRALKHAGFSLVVVSNQSGVARGLFAEEALQPVVRRLQNLLADEGVELAGFFYCPHLPEGSVARYARHCLCRKPAPGLIERAARELDVDLSASWMVGDILDDVEAGSRARCRTLLIDNGHETEWLPGPYRRPHATAPDLNEGAQMILNYPRS